MIPIDNKTDAQILIWMLNNPSPVWELFSNRLDRAILDIFHSPACDNLRKILATHHATGSESNIIIYELLWSKALILHPDLMEEFTHILLTDIREETLSKKEA